MSSSNKKGGISILGILILGFLVIMVLSYFKISVRTVVESPTAQDNLHYVGDTSVSLWDAYLAKPFSYLWNDVWIPIFWRPFIDNMIRLRDGKPTDYQIYAPTVNIQSSQ